MQNQSQAERKKDEKALIVAILATAFFATIPLSFVIGKMAQDSSNRPSPSSCMKATFPTTFPR